MNDDEARIREAENRLRALELFAQQARQRAVGQYQAALLMTQIGGAGRQPVVVFTDPTCNVDLGTTLTANLAWGFSSEFSGAITLNWDSGNSWWLGCGVLHWPGSSLAATTPFYDSTIACDTPVRITLVPPASVNYTWKIELFTANVTNSNGATLRAPVAGTCTATFNFTWGPLNQGPLCSPWRVPFAASDTGSTVIGTGTNGLGHAYSTVWNLSASVTSP